LPGRQTVAPSSISAWLKSPGWRGSSQPCATVRKRSRVSRRRDIGGIVFDASHHRNTLPIHHRAGAIETPCSRWPRPCHAAYAGEARGCRRNRAGTLPRPHLARGAQQIAGAGVIPKAAPQRQHLFFAGRCQRRGGGEPLDEALVVGDGPSAPGSGWSMTSETQDSVWIGHAPPGDGSRWPRRGTRPAAGGRPAPSLDDAKPFGDYRENPSAPRPRPGCFGIGAAQPDLFS